MATGYLGTSQNGWSVYDDAHFQDHAVRTVVKGVGFWSANGDVAVVMDDFTQKYNNTIESITLPVSEAPGYDDWSRALRAVRGQTTGYSNHASCTARDLNSTRHPRGVHNTYSAAHRAALHDLVNDELYQVNGRTVLRDGEFYGPNSTIDGMHVEIVGTPAEVKTVADRIREKDPLMADKISDSNLKAIADEVWNSDRIPVNDSVTGEPNPANPMWQADGVLAQLLKNQQRIERKLDQLLSTQPPTPS